MNLSQSHDKATDDKVEENCKNQKGLWFVRSASSSREIIECDCVEITR